MTAVAGFTNGTHVWIGADSLGSNYHTGTPRRDDKVFRNGEFLIGFTSSYRMGQLLRYSFEPPEIDTDDLMRYMVTSFVEEVRKCFRVGGYIREDASVESGGVFLVGVRGRLFCIQGDFQVAEAIDPYYAIGSGEDHALGAMYQYFNTYSGWQWDEDHGCVAAEAIMAGLHAADAFVTTVSGPFLVMGSDGLVARHG